MTDSTAFIHTFNELRGDLLSTFFLILGSHHDAQDAAQDTFLKCWRVRAGLAEVRNPRAWIFRIGINAARDLRRKRARLRCTPITASLTEAAVAPNSTVEEVERSDELEQLRRAIRHLRSAERQVFLLRQQGDLTYQEIGEFLVQPVGTVKTLMRAALRKLREVLHVKAEAGQEAEGARSIAGRGGADRQGTGRPD